LREEGGRKRGREEESKRGREEERKEARQEGRKIPSTFVSTKIRVPVVREVTIFNSVHSPSGYELYNCTHTSSKLI